MKTRKSLTLIDSIDLSAFPADGTLDYLEIAQLVSKQTGHQFIFTLDGVPDCISTEIFVLEHLVEDVDITGTNELTKIQKAYRILIDAPTLTTDEFNLAVASNMLYLRHKNIMYDELPEDRFKQICYAIVS